MPFFSFLVFGLSTLGSLVEKKKKIKRNPGQDFYKICVKHRSPI